MICPKCGAENPENAYFCGSCGYQLKSALEQPQGPATLGRPGDPLGGKPLDTSAPGAGLLPPPEQPPYTPPAAHYAPPEPYSPPASTPPPEQQAYIPPAQYPTDGGPSRGSGAYTPPPAQQPYHPPQHTEQQPQYGPPQQPYHQPQAGYQQPYQGQPGYQQPYQQPPQGYQPPPAQYGPPQQGYGQGAPGQPGYTQGYNPPADNNTSGMGPGYYEPSEANGWTFAGFVPFGLYAFLMGNVMWGVIGLVTWLFGFYLIYSIYIGIQGKRLAWQGRCFESIQQYWETQRMWNIAGIICLVLAVVLFMFVSCVSMLAEMGDAVNP